MALFSKFSKLPPELRLDTWKLAATTPRVIHIELQPDKLTALNGPHPLLSTCWESRLLYKEQMKDQSHDKLEAENGKFLVDFTQDVFFFERHPHSTTPPATLAGKIEKAAFRQDSLCCIGRLSSSMPRLRQVDLVLRDEPYQYQPAPTSAFRPHSSLHLCSICPSKYFNLYHFPQIGDPCLTCVWLADMYYDQLLFKDGLRGFTPAFDCSLGIYPTREEILGCKHPMIVFDKTGSLQAVEEGYQSIKQGHACDW